MRKIDYNSYEKPSDFIKFPSGDSRVRIVSEGIICYEHGMMKGGRYVPLGVCTETAECDQCIKGNDAKLRFKWIAYLPEINEVRVLAVGMQIGDEVCCMAKKEDPRGYDIIVNRQGVGKQTRYKVRKSQDSTKVSDPKILEMIKQRRDYLIRKHLT